MAGKCVLGWRVDLEGLACAEAGVPAPAPGRGRGSGGRGATGGRGGRGRGSGGQPSGSGGAGPPGGIDIAALLAAARTNLNGGEPPEPLEVEG